MRLTDAEKEDFAALVGTSVGAWDCSFCGDVEGILCLWELEQTGKRLVA